MPWNGRDPESLTSAKTESPTPTLGCKWIKMSIFNLCDWIMSLPYQPPPTVHLEGIQDGCWLIQELDADSRLLDARQRSDFSEPRLSHLLLHRKALNSLLEISVFSLINSQLLMFQLPGCSGFFFVCKNPTCPGSSLMSLEQSLRALWACLPGLSPQ